MTVQQLMATNVVTTDPDDDIASVADLMLNRSVGCVVVLSDNALTGVITDRDLLNCLAAAHDAGLCSVSAHMSSPVITVEPDADLVTAAGAMVGHQIKRLPVVGPPGLVGILSFSDIAGVLHEDADTRVRDLESLAVLLGAGTLHRRS